MNLRLKIALGLLVLTGISGWATAGRLPVSKSAFITDYLTQHRPREFKSDPEFSTKLAQAAQIQLAQKVRYSSAYHPIAYPMGDVPAHLGVCSDVLIRAYRGVGIDLQQLVHEDMRKEFSAYPNLWLLRKTDPNIDHRRVPNLMVFFNRAGASLPISSQPQDYLPGDIVAWDLGNAVTHIGLIAESKSEKSGNPLIIHNIGAGVQQEDKLFAYRIIGHYRYQPH